MLIFRWTDYRRHGVEFDDDVTEVYITNGEVRFYRGDEVVQRESASDVKAVDVSGLTSPSALEYLVIEGTDIHELHLEPLRHCRSLRVVTLMKNRRLERLDLTPLAFSPRLLAVFLRENPKLTHVDVTPLAARTFLEHLDMGKTRPDTPQRGITFLSEEAFRKRVYVSIPIGIRENRNDYIYPIRHFDVPVDFSSPDLIMRLIPVIADYEPESWKHLHLARALLQEAGPEERAFLDIKPEDLRPLVGPRRTRYKFADYTSDDVNTLRTCSVAR